jgi:hypothetical protein
LAIAVAWTSIGPLLVSETDATPSGALASW